MRREAEARQARAEESARSPRMSRSEPANSEPLPKRLPAKLSQLIRALMIRAKDFDVEKVLRRERSRKIGDRKFCPMIFPTSGRTFRRPSQPPNLPQRLLGRSSERCRMLGRVPYGRGLAMHPREREKPAEKPTRLETVALVARAERPNDALRELLLLFHGEIFRREEAANVVDDDGCEETFSGISLECASEPCKRVRVLDLRTG